jgi:hypothetical protein
VLLTGTNGEKKEKLEKGGPGRVSLGLEEYRCRPSMPRKSAIRVPMITRLRQSGRSSFFSLHARRESGETALILARFYIVTSRRVPAAAMSRNPTGWSLIHILPPL